MLYGATAICARLRGTKIWRFSASICLLLYEIRVYEARTVRPGAHWDAGGRRAGRRSTGNTAWQSVSAHWEVVSCNLAMWAMAEFIALSSESDSDEEMDTLMLLYFTSKRQNSVWKSEYMKKRKTHGEFALTSEFSAKQFTNYYRNTAPRSVPDTVSQRSPRRAEQRRILWFTRLSMSARVER